MEKARRLLHSGTIFYEILMISPCPYICVRINRTYIARVRPNVGPKVGNTVPL